MRHEDIGGVHIKYLHHCHRQLWLYARGMRPEHLSARVSLGEAVHDTSYPRSSPVDLGAATLDYLDGRNWVHEVKSGSRPTAADRAQALHYCHRLHQLGVAVAGAILHYPKTRRTERLPWTEELTERTETDIRDACEVIAADHCPERLARSACRGCSYVDYCWSL